MKVRTFPNAITLIVGFLLVAGVLTYIIPKGQYQRVLDPETKREIVVPGSYKRIDVKHLTPFEILLCVPRGIVNGGEVMVLIFLVGGCLFIVEKSGALLAGVTSLTTLVKGKEEFALIFIAFLFVVGGATEGLQEEIIPLIPVLLILTRQLGYTPFVTICISFGAAVVGSAFSPVNPFGVVIAQRMADVPFLTGSAFRLVVLVIAFSVWMAIVIRYANKNRIVINKDNAIAETSLSRIHKIILYLVMSAFALLIFGMLSLGWGSNQISAEFFAVGIIIGLISGLGINGTFIAFAEGFKELTFAAMIVGFSYGIPLILKEGFIIDSIIYGLFVPLEHVSPMISVLGMMGSQAFLHISLPSYSGQAVLTMPILAPLSDLIGISRDVCVMAYQYGAILMDMIIPSSGALMAILTVAGISYDQWFTFLFKKILVIFLLSGVALMIAILIGL